MSSNLLLLMSALCALCAIFFPQLSAIMSRVPFFGLHSIATRDIQISPLQCPLGYGRGRTDDGSTPQSASKFHADAFGSTAAGEAQMHKPETWFINANVWTFNPDIPWANAFAVDGRGIISAVCKQYSVSSGQARRERSSEGEQLLGQIQDDENECTVPSTAQVVDLHGRFTMSSFIDPHVHLIPAGLALSRANLAEADSQKSFEAIMRSAASSSPSDAWIQGQYGMTWLTTKQVQNIIYVNTTVLEAVYRVRVLLNPAGGSSK